MKITLNRFLKSVATVLLCVFSTYAAEQGEARVVVKAIPDQPAINGAVPDRNTLVKKVGEDDVRPLCSGMKACLGIDVPGCTNEDKLPLKKVKYDEEFCGIFKEVKNRGLSTDMNVTGVPEIFARLGRQYRAVYVNEGTLPLNEHVISYLFDNMPFTAELINAYLESNYTLEYASKDRRFFNGSNGRSLSGEFYWALQDSTGQKLGLRDLFFGYGHAKVLRWSLTGTAIALLDMDPIPGNQIKYKLTAVVFPANSVLNSIMQMKVFKNVVNSKIDQIVDDIKKASGMYFGGNKEPMLKSAALKSQQNIQYVLDFETVVNGAPWKLGDFEKLQKERAKAKAEAAKPAPLKIVE